MKLFVLAILFLLLVGMTGGMPDDMLNNTDVCKIEFDTGSSMIGIFAWHNLTSHQWEVVVGTATYEGVHASNLFTGDDDGMVELTRSGF